MIDCKLSALKQCRPLELALRFAFGGLSTVLAGLMAKHFGPVVGGFFLAFPAIFPASATLIEDHERRRKKEISCDGTNRGRLAAALDACGTALGALGLMGFAVVVWLLLPRHNPVAIIALATAVWFAVSVALWRLRRAL